MKVFVVIVTYNGLKWIDKCLSSVLKTNIIVVDNGSDDGTVQRIEESYKEVKLIESQENLGFGKANNIGIKYAIEKGAEYIFLLNQDAWVDENTIQTLVNRSLANNQFGMLSPVHLTGSGHKIDSSFYHCFNQKSNYEMLNSFFNKSDNKIIEISFVNAALWLLPVKHIKTVGGFDPIFSHYGEDVDYVSRIKHQGLKCGVVTNTFGYHDREYREFSRSRDFQQRKMRYLRLLKDVNNILCYNLINLFYHLVKQMLKDIGKLKVTWILQDILYTTKLILGIKKIIKTRKKSISRLTPYLN